MSVISILLATPATSNAAGAVSSSVEGYALVIAITIAAIGLGGTAIASGKAYRVLGRIEGKVERYGDRLQEHSDTLKEHDAILMQLLGLPKTVRDIGGEIFSIKRDVQTILSKLQRNGNTDDKGNGDG